MIWILHSLLVIGIAALIAACGSSPADIGVEAPPLVVRMEGTVPRDSTENLFEAGGMPVVVSFNREFSADEITFVELIPRPVSWGPVRVPGSNRRQLVIEGVVFDSAHAAYRLVIDGPAMPEPKLLTYCGGTLPHAEGAIEGHITNEWTGRAALNALVYALPSRQVEDEVETRSDEFTFFGHPVLGAARSLDPDSGAVYRLTGLEVGAHYIVVAILDFDGDGIYDLTKDWWGYHRDYDHRPIELVAGLQATDSKEPEGPPMPAGVDVSVLPPGSLEDPFGLLPGDPVTDRQAEGES